MFQQILNKIIIKRHHRTGARTPGSWQRCQGDVFNANQIMKVPFPTH
jgi:hypothetical protein